MSYAMLWIGMVIGSALFALARSDWSEFGAASYWTGAALLCHYVFNVLLPSA